MTKKFWSKLSRTLFMKAWLVSIVCLSVSLSAQVIFKKDSPQSFLFSDKRALKKGDLLTVIISERVMASQSADTSAKRDDKHNLDAGTGILDFLKGWGLTSKEDFKGVGKTNRSGQLVATLTVQVIGLLPNGTYKVEGHQEIKVNREKQILHLSGIVRSVDVGPNNTVLSTKIGNAKIEFEGKGLLNRKQKRPWLFRLLDHIF